MSKKGATIFTVVRGHPLTKQCLLLGEKRYAKTDLIVGQKETVACLEICFLEKEKYLKTVAYREISFF